MIKSTLTQRRVVGRRGALAPLAALMAAATLAACGGGGDATAAGRGARGLREGHRRQRPGAAADEPGCLRFDVHQQVDDPHRFVLHEIYTDERAFYEAHRSTAHYAAWREVAARCVVPGGHVNTFCRPLFPNDVAASTSAPGGTGTGTAGEWDR